MNLISKIFKKSSSNGINVMNDVSNFEASKNVNQVSEELFVDHNKPDAQRNSYSGAHILNEFLDYDFYNEGYKDGYNCHSNQILESKIKAIKAEFRLKLDQKAEKIQQYILKLQDSKLEIDGLLDYAENSIDNRIEIQHHILQKIEKEKENSAMGEGLVMRAIHDYKEGFLKGTSAYLDLEVLASNKGLFN